MKPLFDSKPFSLNDSLTLENGEVVTIDQFRFYISHIALWKNDREVWKEKNSFHLHDLNNPESMSLNLLVADDLDFTSVQFRLGIDSLTNVSGAFGGDLDPTKGMYWAWNSGYINLKLEGRNASCPTRNNQFQFHLGGYQAPFSSKIILSENWDGSSDLELELSLSDFLNSLDFTNQHTIMSPGSEGKELMDLTRKMFSDEEY